MRKYQLIDKIMQELDTKQKLDLLEEILSLKTQQELREICKDNELVNTENTNLTFKLVSSFNEHTIYIKAATKDQAYEIFRENLTEAAEYYADHDCDDDESTREENIESFKWFRSEEYGSTIVEKIPGDVCEEDIL